MSRIANKLITAASGSGADSAYTIDQSLVFNAPSYTGLVMSSGNDGNHRKWTWSGWVKKAENLLTSTSHNNEIFASTSANGQILVQLSFYQDTLYWAEYNSGSKGHFQTNRVFRDPSAWYHIVVVYDSAQGSASDRIKPYINGVRETSFVAFINVPQNYDSSINTASIPLKIGNDYGYIDSSQAQYGYNGNIAEVHYLDGTSYDASYFGETNSDTGQWIPKEYTDGNYGTNGFYLKFVSGAIGTDSSGEGNNFTVTNLANADVVTDTPTNNFATWDSVGSSAVTVFSEGNLKMSSGATFDLNVATIGATSGKWYWEQVASSGVQYYHPGFCNDKVFETGEIETSWPGNTANSWSYYAANGRLYNNNAIIGADLGSSSGGDIIGMAMDLDNQKVWFSKNGTWLGTDANPSTGAGPAITNLVAGTKYYPCSEIYNISNITNFGQNGTLTGHTTAGGNADANGIGDFKYAVPTGFKALCTANLPDPAIPLSSAQFNTVLYTGDDTDGRTISGVGFQPDFVWHKARNATNYHWLFNAVRGATKFVSVNDPMAEATQADSLSAFTSDGFTVSDNTSSADMNSSSHTYVTWNWKANGSGSTDTSGDIDCVLSANPTSGFSVLSFTGNDSNNDTIPHGLGVVPDFIWYKAGDSAWETWINSSIISGNKRMLLNRTDAVSALSSNYLIGGEIATSSMISNNGLTSSQAVIAWCFASKEGFSKIGAYTGNGSATAGPFVNCGFKPALVITKRMDATGYWGIFDAARAPGNVAAFPALFPNVSDAEVTGTYLDLLSNGFKIRITSAHYNADGGTYLYMAFAESPFKYANAR